MHKSDRQKQTNKTSSVPAQDPIVTFQRWFAEAKVRCAEFRRMVLATVGQDGAPNARVVYLQYYPERGLHFFTNYESQKGQELTANAAVAGVLCWQELDRQVRFRGTAVPCASQTSDEYFEARPDGCRFAAAWSQQSRPLADLSALRERVKGALERGVVPPTRPAAWGGYVIEVQEWEFWQKGPHRLHHRVAYSQQPTNTWLARTLSP